MASVSKWTLSQPQKQGENFLSRKCREQERGIWGGGGGGIMGALGRLTLSYHQKDLHTADKTQEREPGRSFPEVTLKRRYSLKRESAKAGRSPEHRDFKTSEAPDRRCRKEGTIAPMPRRHSPTSSALAKSSQEDRSLRNLSSPSKRNFRRESSVRKDEKASW